MDSTSIPSLKLTIYPGERACAITHSCARLSRISVTNTCGFFARIRVFSPSQHFALLRTAHGLARLLRAIEPSATRLQAARV